VVFTTLVFYQPSLQNFNGDYRINSSSSLNFTVSRHLALTAAYTYSYESIAVENRSPLNTNLTVGFTYSTGK
jgi:putative salt-induced outer membrane protein YdiY